MSFGQCDSCKGYLTLEEYNACQHRPSGDTPGLCFACMYRIVDKFPTTADGITITPPMRVWFLAYGEKIQSMNVGAIDWFAGKWLVREWPDTCRAAGEVFSTPEAAEAARETT